MSDLVPLYQVNAGKVESAEFHLHLTGDLPRYERRDCGASHTIYIGQDGELGGNWHYTATEAATEFLKQAESKVSICRKALAKSEEVLCEAKELVSALMNNTTKTLFWRQVSRIDSGWQLELADPTFKADPDDHEQMEGRKPLAYLWAWEYPSKSETPWRTCLEGVKDSNLDYRTREGAMDATVERATKEHGITYYVLMT